MIPQKAIIILLSLVFFSFLQNKEKEMPRQGKDYAVFFAVKDYSHWDDLRNPISDAMSIADELKTNYGFETEVVKNPTLVDILDKLDEYSDKKYTSDGQLLIFFSGHGDFIAKTQEGFFIPADGERNDTHQRSYIPHTRLERIINALPCNHILLAIDACFSGTFDEAIALNRGDERPGAQTNMRQSFINRSLKYKTRLYLTSGGKERTPDESQFVKQFLSALRNFGGSDGIVSFNELVGSLEIAKPQPKSGQFGDHETGGNFLMILDDNNTSKSSVTTSTPKGNTNTVKDNTTTTSNIDPRLADLNGWKAAEKTKSLEGYQKYIREFSSGAFIEKAKQKEKLLLEETEWEIAKTLDTKDAYQKYIREFPNGANIDKAKQKEKLLAEETEWEIAKTLDTEDAYKKYLVDYPNGKYRKEATFPDNAQTGTFTDDRDKQVYKWVRMKDGKIWMKENLNYEMIDSWCYDNEVSNCVKYGRLYTWEAANKACPSGFRLSSAAEWTALAKANGGYYNSFSNKNFGDPKAGYEALIDGGSSGYSALLGGSRSSNGSYHRLGEYGSYWSSTEYEYGSSSSSEAWDYVFYKSNKLSRARHDKKGGSSCRCVNTLKNNTTTTSNIDPPLADVNAFKTAEKTNSLEGYQKYLDDYPNGVHRKEAISQIIGSTHEGGIVFYVDETGHGLVCSNEDLGRFIWSMAKTACEAYSEGGYTDWYLPSKMELKMMYTELQKNTLGGFVNHNYWSSTEYDKQDAWKQYFKSGSEDIIYKGNQCYVRAVRAF